MRRRYRGQPVCERCGCQLDAGEGLYCSDCREEIRQEEAYARKWNLTTKQVQELRREGLISA